MLCQLDVPVVIVNFDSDFFCSGSEYTVWNHYLATAKDQEGTGPGQRRSNVTILLEEGTHSDGAAMFNNLQPHERASRALVVAWQGYWTELLRGGKHVSRLTPMTSLGPPPCSFCAPSLMNSVAVSEPDMSLIPTCLPEIAMCCIPRSVVGVLPFSSHIPRAFQQSLVCQ